jgi:Protein of unknown function (DUF3040)
MGLPATQQRVLNRMEGALRASEPHMAAMFAIFSRLSAGEPVGRESLAGPRWRRWWLRPGSSMAVLVLVPVMLALIITGVLLGGPPRAGTCAVGMPAAGTMPRAGQAACGGTGRAGQRPGSGMGAVPCPRSGGPNAAATTAHFAVWARNAATSWPSGRTAAFGLC